MALDRPGARVNGLDAQIAQLRAQAAARPPAAEAPDCPPSQVWDEIATGVLRAEEAGLLLRHGASCGHCGPLLRDATKTLEGEGTIDAEPNVETELAALPSSRRGGRQRLARRLRRLQRTMGKGTSPRSAWWRSPWAYGATAAAATALLLVWAPGVGRRYLAEHLVAQAYGQHRSLALRFAGADYGPLLGVRRGAPEPPPGALLEAEGLVAGALEKRPDDIGLLQTQARAYLIEGNAAAALADLQRALVLQPGAPGLQTDLASAYFEGAEAGHDPDYGSALEHLGRALAASPRDPVALFNRALVEEALEDWTGAIADWSAYIAVDARSPWTEEARRHLAADRRLVAGHDAAAAAPLLSPSAFARIERVDAATDARMEDYLRIATTDWLPAAFPPTGTGDPGTLAGLHRLAAWLQHSHHDTWLAQMLGKTGAPQAFAQAVASLANAVVVNAEGKPDQAMRAARQSEAEFARARSPVGRARAAYEEVYGLHRAERADQCLATLNRLLSADAIAPYGWLAGETALERANCESMAGRNGHAELVRAAAIGRADGYPSLYMRAVSFIGEGVRAPDSEPTWRLHRDQLALYWRTPVNPYRAYQLDMMLALYSSQRRDWYAAERLAGAAIERVALTPERSYEAMAREELANYAEQCGFAAEARSEAARAEALFAALPQTPTTANLRAFNEIDQAAIEMRVGQPVRARAELAAYRRDQPPVVSLDARALPYFALLGRLELAQGHADLAERNERAAIAIDENDRGRLATDEDRLDWQQRNRDAYRAWVEIEWRLHQDPVAALEFWEWAKGTPLRPPRALPASFLAAARAFDAAGAPPLPEPDAVRTSLTALRRQQIVSYALLPRELAIWVFDNRGIHGVRMPVDSVQLEAAAHAFASACADPGGNPALRRTEAQQLYRMLLAPVAAWLDPARTLTVEPDGALAEIPFAALQSPDGRYLPQPIRQSPGVAYARLARPEPRTLATARILAVANPAAGLDPAGVPYPPLPETKAEAEETAASFGAGSAVLADDDATAKAVLAALPHAEIFHFAGHAESNRLLLANGSALTALDFTPATLPRCQLAMLAACSTGAGAALVDSTGLVRALLRAGVPEVVASRWQVDSAATRQFSRFFYAALRAGASVPRALQSAEQQLRRQPATAAPFYWAAFADFSARL